VLHSQLRAHNGFIELAEIGHHLVALATNFNREYYRKVKQTIKVFNFIRDVSVDYSVFSQMNEEFPIFFTQSKNTYDFSL